MVSKWGQRVTKYYAAYIQICEDESSLVGKILLEVIEDYILTRDVGLDASGKLDKITLNLAAKLQIPHHVGAGCEEDFADKEAFQKHIRRISKQNKRLK
jgi:hypothetical protein